MDWWSVGEYVVNAPTVRRAAVWRSGAPDRAAQADEDGIDVTLLWNSKTDAVFAQLTNYDAPMGPNLSAGFSPSSCTAISRMRYFWIFPVIVIGKDSTIFQ
jgi:hypothetical protein